MAEKTCHVGFNDLHIFDILCFNCQLQNVDDFADSSLLF